MLNETFKGRSAQLLAVIEALSDSKRRILQTSLGAPESDDSILDVFAELFFAGSELIGGGGGGSGGGKRSFSSGKNDPVIGGNVVDAQLIDMAVKGNECICYFALFVQLICVKIVVDKCGSI